MLKLSDAPSYQTLVAARAAYEADPTPVKGKAWAQANDKCRREVGLRSFLPAAAQA